MTDRYTGPHLGRRPLLAATATGGLAVAGLAVGNRTGLFGNDPDGSAEGVLQLNETDYGVQSLEFPLEDDVLTSVGRGEWQTLQLPTTTHSMVAVTWSRQRLEPTVEVSSRRGGTWRPWQRLPSLNDLPDADGGEGNGRDGTDLAWVGLADGVRARLRGNRPSDLRLVLLHPASTAVLERRTLQGRRVPAERLKPVLLTRRDWGANPAWRNGTPSYNPTIEQVHIHHTANSNDYAADDVPGLIRGMYSYHTQSLGWSDIAYNFLVDRFGRTWVGRAGGPGRPVRGAHTLGFNASSTGVAAIGNYDTAKPSAQVLEALAQLAAWKLALYDRDPLGKVAVTSEGSDNYRAGARPRLPVIDGHRDTNDTACPGSNLYAALPAVRELAHRKLVGNQAVLVTTEPVLMGQLVVGRALTTTSGRVEPTSAQVKFQWFRDRGTIPGATAATYLVTSGDVGSLLSVAITYIAADHAPTTRTLIASSPIRAVPSIAIDAVSNQRGITVTVTVTAPGATRAPTGTVIVSLPERDRSVVMSTGRVRVRFKHPARRPRPVLVRYAGNAEITSGTAEATVLATSTP